jgi:hypothetical protein
MDMTRLNRPVVLGAAALGLMVFTDLAEAQQRARQQQAPPLTIQRRNFLDSGKIVPVGSQNRYVAAITTFAVPVYAQSGVGHGFGYYTLPRRFDPPGRPQPLFEFSTGSGGP